MKALEIQRLDYALPDDEPIPGDLSIETMRELRLIRRAIGCLTKYLMCATAGNEEELERIRPILFGVKEDAKQRGALEMLELSNIVAKHAEAKGNYDPEKMDEYTKEALGAEIDRLGELEKGILILELSLPVLTERTSDQLVRVEAHLSREFDRTLAQLERLQRIRKGQPVPPTLKVEVDTRKIAAALDHSRYGGAACCASANNGLGLKASTTPHQFELGP